jgi:hypothetical protein
MTTAADYKPTNKKRDLPNISGVQARTMRMLGDAGAIALGKGDWVDFGGAERKTFFLYPVDQKNDSLGSAAVEIQGCIELAAESTANQDNVPDTKFKVLGTLNAGSPHLVVVEPWPYIRAVVTVAGTAANEFQVGAHAILP